MNDWYFFVQFKFLRNFKGAMRRANNSASRDGVNQYCTLNKMLAARRNSRIRVTVGPCVWPDVQYQRQTKHSYKACHMHNYNTIAFALLCIASICFVWDLLSDATLELYIPDLTMPNTSVTVRRERHQFALIYYIQIGLKIWQNSREPAKAWLVG